MGDRWKMIFKASLAQVTVVLRVVQYFQTATCKLCRGQYSKAKDRRIERTEIKKFPQ